MKRRCPRSCQELLKAVSSLILPLAVLWLSACEVFGTTYRTPPAIETNVLVFDGKIIFTQGSGGLTVLDLHTGQVVLRKNLGSEIRYAHELLPCSKGVLFVNDGESTLVDPNKFEPLWTIKGCHNPVVEDGFIVSHDGYHTVRCHDSVNGRELWAQEHQGGWSLTLSNGTVVVSTIPFYDGQSVFWAIDAKTGRQLFQKASPADKQWGDVKCDGATVYAITCPRESPRFEVISDAVVKFDLQGHEIHRLDISSPQIIVGDETYKYPFLMDDKVFERHQNVRAAYHHELNGGKGIAVLDDTFTFSLPSGLLLSKGSAIQMISTASDWSAYLTYMGPNEYVESAVESDGRILLCCSGGQIECFDSATGNPQWLYVFPSFRRVLSYSNLYIGDYRRSHETLQASIFRLGSSFLGQKRGSIHLPTGTKLAQVQRTNLSSAPPYPGAIIVDPAPDILFEDLSGRVVKSTIAGATSAAGLLALLIWHRLWITAGTKEHNQPRSSPRRHYTLYALGCFTLFCLVSTWILLYGRVSGWCTALYWGIAITALISSQRAISAGFRDGFGAYSLVWLMFTAALLGLVCGLTAFP